MKFLCNGSELREATNKIKSVISGNSPEPILNGIKIVAKDGTVEFTAKDNDTTIDKKVIADVKIEGETVVEGKFFCDLCNLLKDTQIEIVVSSDNKMTIKYGENVVDANCFDPNEYPPNTVIDSANHFVMMSRDFCELVKKIDFCAGTDSGRPILKGIFLELEDDNITGVTLDGYRLAKVAKKLEKSVEEKFSCVVPAKSLSDAAKIIGDNLDTITFHLNKSFLVLDAGHIKITISLLEGDYINYRQVIPATVAATAILEKDTLKKSIERVKLITMNEKANSLSMEFGSVQTILSSKSQRGTITEKLASTLDGIENKIGFNAKFVTDALDAIDTESVTIKMNTPTSPVLFLPTGGDEGVMYLVLPLRLSE